MGIFRICQKRDGTRTAFFDFCKRGYGYISIAFNYATGENGYLGSCELHQNALI
jgi:hypothetical protein